MDSSFLVPLLGLMAAYVAVVMPSLGNNLLYEVGRSFSRRGFTLRLTKAVEGVMGLWFWGLGVIAFAMVLFVTTKFRTPTILPVSLVTAGVIVGTAVFAYLLGHKIKLSLVVLLCVLLILGLALVGTQTA